MRAPAGITTLLLDVDGVLTPGLITYAGSDFESKSFHARDGHAIKWALRSGLRVGAVSGRRGPAVERRLAELGCEPCLLGVSDKVAEVEAWFATAGGEWASTAFVGDDIPDLPCMERAAWGVAVADAAPALRRRAHAVTHAVGGSGAVAEVIRCLLRGRDALANDRVVMHG